MDIKHQRQVRLIIYIVFSLFSLFLTQCHSKPPEPEQTQSTSAAAISPTATHTPTATPDLLATRFAGLPLTQTARPTPTNTSNLFIIDPQTKTPIKQIFATATLAFTHTATLEPQPLSSQGPWIVISSDQYLVMNADGSSLQPIPLPNLPDDREWRLLAEPKGSFLAFRTDLLNDAPYNLREDGIDDHIWIVKLPENQIIRQLPQLGDDAWQEIKEIQSKQPSVFDAADPFPTHFGLLLASETYQWSPHGRYFTYSAALDSAYVDLYLYDTQKDTTRRISLGRTGAQVWFWAPDGSTVIYRDGQAVVFPYGYPDLVEINAIYAFNILSGERRLYGSEAWEDPWLTESGVSITNRTFLTYNSCFECNSSNLRLVDYSTGKIKTLYPGKFTEAVSNASEEDIIGNPTLVLFDPSGPAGGGIKEIPPGVYRIDPTGKLIFVTNGWHGLNYDAGAGLFRTVQTDPSGTNFVVLFDIKGEIKARFPGFWAIPSPDNQWYIVENDTSWSLYHRSGELVIDKDGRSDFFWLKDSTGFYTLSCSDETIRFFGLDNNWQPQTVYAGACNSIRIVSP